MANPNNGNAQYDLEKETGVLIVDNCARTTLLNTLFNMSEVQRYSVKISLTGIGMSIKATSGYKTYYIKDAMEQFKNTTISFYVLDLQQGLLP